MAIAAAVLTYVLWWMGRQSRDLGRALRTEAQAALDTGSRLAVVGLAFLAVFREGAETVLYVGAAASTSSGAGVAMGSATGFGAAALAGYVIYRVGSRFPLRTFFRLTTILLLVFAAGMVARSTLAFQAAGVLPGTVTVWDASGLLAETSGAGAALRTLVGYTAAPSLLQVVFWLGYVALVGALYYEPGGGGRTRSRAEAFLPIGGSYRHRLYRVLRWPRLTTLMRASMGLALVFLLVVAVFAVDVGPFDNEGPVRLGPFRGTENGNSLFNFALWIVWLPLLSIVTLVLGRVWCGNLCPLRLVTDWARGLADRIAGRGSPASSSLRLGWLLPSAFVLITFLVKWWPVQRVALYGALLFLAILGLAAAVGFCFRRRTWCRYICPVGGWLARIARLSPLVLRPNVTACATCRDKPCLTGTALAGRCPTSLNPSRLESNQHCLKCWDCVVNCPLEKGSLRLGVRAPGAELLEPRSPNLWESLFVAGLLGMCAAAGHRSAELARLPWPLLFFGLVALATLLYVGVCAVAGRLAGVSFRRALTTFGYVFLPLEFGTAVIAFGDDALEFFGIVQLAAALLLTVGFVWSVILGVSILRNQSRSRLRAVAAGVPVGAILVAVLLVWLQWYASGTVIDLT